MFIALFLAFWAGVRTGGFFGAPDNNREFSLAAMSNMFSVFGGGGAFVALESPKTMFTKQYSISAMNTNLKIVVYLI